MKIKLPTRLQPLALAAEKNMPTILTAYGCVSVIVTGILSARSYKRATDILHDKWTERTDEELENGDDIEYSLSDHVRYAWKAYIPPVLVGSSGILAMIFANKVNLNRNLALAGAYELSRTAFEEYRAQVVERIGEKKEGEIRGEVAQKQIDKDPPTQKQLVIINDDEILCRESFGGAYFHSTIENIRRIENELNKRLMNEMWIPLNDLYYELGIQRTDGGDYVGWNINRDGFINFDYDSALDPNGKPCLVLGFLVGPREGYGDLN